jgi:hypothetical protein
MSDINRYITANETIQRLCRVLGLPVPTSSAGATDSMTVQMWALLTECGQEIMDEYEWQIINKTYLLTIQDPVLEYGLPSDFQSFVDSTGWNRTSRIPLIGPLTSQQWQLLEARQLGGTTLRLQYLIEDDKLKFYWAPSDVQEIAIAYQGRGWVRDGTDPLIFRDYVENDGDIVLFDPRMVQSKLKLEWRRRKGFEVVDDQAAYDKALNTAKYNDRPKNDLQTSGSSSYPYLGYLNMPDTNYGNP